MRGTQMPRTQALLPDLTPASTCSPSSCWTTHAAGASGTRAATVTATVITRSAAEPCQAEAERAVAKLVGAGALYTDRPKLRAGRVITQLRWLVPTRPPPSPRRTPTSPGRHPLRMCVRVASLTLVVRALRVIVRSPGRLGLRDAVGIATAVPAATAARQMACGQAVMDSGSGSTTLRSYGRRGRQSSGLMGSSVRRPADLNIPCSGCGSPRPDLWSIHEAGQALDTLSRSGSSSSGSSRCSARGYQAARGSGPRPWWAPPPPSWCAAGRS